ncbi:LOW QUALITY PROTEIN: hypothetical protein MAR_023412 [Mya arenaria]|uniref:Uncharacterized protein n=1 Tax=Mya arenaria TaxID=6604 RepID=A0ABY7DNT7_MYAAR|nr:LOW QUALITY PROTEIN: hypothetical protein MAR_023412 [Mya arenaria]
MCTMSEDRRGMQHMLLFFGSCMCSVIAEKPSSSMQNYTQTDWNLCELCPAKTPELMLWPANSRRADVDVIPAGVNLHHLNIDTGLENVLYEYSAVWHKTCRNKIGNDKLQNASKRKTEESHNRSPVKTRRSLSEHQQQIQTKTCVSAVIILLDPLVFTRPPRLKLILKTCATELCDTKLLAKLACGDMIAIDAHYHAKCLAKLYKRVQLSRKAQEESPEKVLHGIVFAGLGFIQNGRHEEPVHIHLGLDQVQVHTTRLKDWILAAILDLRSQTEGRDILIIYDDEIGTTFKQSFKDDCNSDALILAKASKFIRRDVFQLAQSFNGCFPADCREKAVPQSLYALVNMLLTGPNIKDHCADEKPILYGAKTISQLMVFNSIRSAKIHALTTHRRNRDRETPAPIYLALKIHLDTLHNMGLCISYDRLLGLSTDIANKVCAMYDEKGVVCPPKIARDIFTVSAVIKIDHNLSSATARDSFHGTGISLMQLRSEQHDGSPRVIPNTGTSCSLCKCAASGLDHSIAVASANSSVWLEHVRGLLSKQELTKEDFVSWSAYHALIQQVVSAPRTVVTLMPVLLECAHSVAMIKHSMNVERLQQNISSLDKSQSW